MKKFTTNLILLLTVALYAKPQSSEHSYLPKPRLSVGLELAIPGGSYGDLFSIGFGGSAKFEVPITRQVYATATAGYKTFYLNENAADGLTINRGYVPLKVGAKYYPIPFFYGETELGLSLGTSKNAGWGSVWSPGAGVSIPITKDGYIDAGFRYERWVRDGGNIDQLGFRVAYKF